MHITSDEKAFIKDAVKKAERRTSGEIVPVILKQSDFYPAAHFRLALVWGIIFSLITYYTIDFDDPIVLILTQIPGIIFGFLLAYLPFFKRLFTTKSEMEEEVNQKAIEIYFENHVSMTRDRTGIMIFISLLERKVKVLADCGINEKVEKDYWEKIVKNLILNIKRGEIVKGMSEAIETCGNSLEKSFPIKGDDTNEISNDLITE